MSNAFSQVLEEYVGLKEQLLGLPMAPEPVIRRFAAAVENLEAAVSRGMCKALNIVTSKDLENLRKVLEDTVYKPVLRYVPELHGGLFCCSFARGLGTVQIYGRTEAEALTQALLLGMGSEEQE